MLRDMTCVTTSVRCSETDMCYYFIKMLTDMNCVTASARCSQTWTVLLLQQDAQRHELCYYLSKMLRDRHDLCYYFSKMLRDMNCFTTSARCSETWPVLLLQQDAHRQTCVTTSARCSETWPWFGINSRNWSTTSKSLKYLTIKVNVAHFCCGISTYGIELRL